MLDKLKSSDYRLWLLIFWPPALISLTISGGVLSTWFTHTSSTLRGEEEVIEIFFLVGSGLVAVLANHKLNRLDEQFEKNKAKEVERRAMFNMWRNGEWLRPILVIGAILVAVILGGLIVIHPTL